MDSLRISDAERQEAVELLNEQYAVGRLTSEELDERSDAAWSAKTRGDLLPLFVDLPVGPHRSVVPTWPNSSFALVGSAGAGWPPPVPPTSARRQGVARYVGPLIALLVVLTVLTHLPFVLLAVVAWFVVGRGFRQHRAHPTQGRRW